MIHPSRTAWMHRQISVPVHPSPTLARITRPVWRCAALLVVLSATACAPMNTVRPVVPFPRNTNNAFGLFGGGQAPLKKLPSLPAEAMCEGCWRQTSNFYEGGLYYWGKPTDRLDLGVVSWFGSLEGGGIPAIGLGLEGAYKFVNDLSQIHAATFGVGAIYASVGMSFAWHLGGDAWFFVWPSVGVREFGTARMPIGVSVSAGEFRFHLSVVPSWGGFMNAPVPAAGLSFAIEG
jgi:hypothetical protein